MSITKFDAVNIGDTLGPQEIFLSKDQVRTYGYRAIGGSDSHLVSLIALCATRFEADVRSIEDLVRELKEGKYEPVDFRPRRKPVPAAVPDEVRHNGG